MKINVFVIPAIALAVGFAAGYFVSVDVPDCPPCPAQECKTCYPTVCSEPFDGVPTDLAKGMIDSYRVHHYAAINSYCSSVAGRPDSRCVWFSLARIKRFVYEIEYKMCSKTNDMDTTELGVRMYFAEYPALANLPSNIDPTYAGLHTLIMVPTYWDGRVDRDFDPAYIGSNGRPTPMDSVGDNLSALVTQGLPANNTMRNHGSMFPPPYPVTTCSGADFMYYADGIQCY